jgi:hypothetical protein
MCHLEKFRALWPSFPQGSVSCDREAPDFIIDAPDGTIGIEVTKLYHPTTENQRPLQEQENLRRQAIDRAQSIYELRQDIPLNVIVGFYPHLDLSKSIIPQIAEDIARIVAEYMPEPDSLIQVRPQIEHRGEYSAHIRVVTVQRFSGLSQGAWNPTGAAWIPECTPEIIQAAVDGKDAKHDVYAQECSEVWLLIVFDTSGLSSTFDMPRETLVYDYGSKFTHLFLLNYAENTIYQLN